MSTLKKVKERIPTVAHLVGLLGHEPALIDRLTKSVAYQFVTRAKNNKHGLLEEWWILDRQYVGKKLIYSNLAKGIKEEGTVVAVRPRVPTDNMSAGYPLTIKLESGRTLTTGSNSGSLEWL